MRLAIFVAAAISATAATVALAEQPSAISNANGGLRQILVCERSGQMERGWLRECASRSQAVDAVATSSAPVARQVFVCDRTAATRRDWIREYGEIAYVTAEEFARAEASNERWSTPRCMTNAEMRRMIRNAPGHEALALVVGGAAATPMGKAGPY